ncbi:MAG: response regulator [Planctomycetota bacterium]
MRIQVHHALRELPVLVGDDDAAVRGCVAELVGSLGLRVVTAGTGTESLHILLSQPVALTILDIHLPDMTGRDVFERYARGPFIAGASADAAAAPHRLPARRVEAIFMSADATPDIRTWVTGIGSRLFDKPFDPADLRAEILRLLIGPDVHGQRGASN